MLERLLWEARPPATLPAVLGFYTLSMSTIASSLVTAVVGEKLPVTSARALEG